MLQSAVFVALFMEILQLHFIFIFSGVETSLSLIVKPKAEKFGRFVFYVMIHCVEWKMAYDMAETWHNSVSERLNRLFRLNGWGGGWAPRMIGPVKNHASLYWMNEEKGLQMETVFSHDLFRIWLLSGWLGVWEAATGGDGILCHIVIRRHQSVHLLLNQSVVWYDYWAAWGDFFFSQHSHDFMFFIHEYHLSIHVACNFRISGCL